MATSNSIIVTQAQGVQPITVEADLGGPIDVTLVVKDVVGRSLMQPERIVGASSFRRTFDISHLANGIYFVQVIGNEGIAVKQVVKQ